MKKLITLVTLSLFISLFFSGVSTGNDGNVKEKSKDITFDKIYPHALRGDIKKTLEILDSLPNAELTEEQLQIKQKYYKRFREQSEKLVIKTDDLFVRYIIETFRNYWNKVFLQESSLEMAEQELQNNITEYLFANNLVDSTKSNEDIKKNLKETVVEVLKEKGFYMINGRTRPYLDLLIWKDQTEQEYVAQLPGGKQRVKVVFMDNFVSHGWAEYATLGKSRAGGWTTKDAIYCLKSYDVLSENFRVSLLVHEGQHFADYKSFPKLKQADLEYRAKLAELSKAEETIYSLLKSFKGNSKYDRKHPHQFAEYCLIRDLSKILFNQDFVSDMKKWEAIPYEKINEASAKLLKRNTRQLKSAGAETVTELLK